MSSVSLSDYNLLFVTNLVSVIGTGFTCNAPALVPVVLASCTFNIMSAFTSLMLSILVGYDTLLPLEVEQIQMLTTHSNITTFSNVVPEGDVDMVEDINGPESGINIDRLFMQDLDTSQLLFASMVPSDNDGTSSNTNRRFFADFRTGIEHVRNTLRSSVYTKTPGMRCLKVTMLPSLFPGDRKVVQEVCLSKYGLTQLRDSAVIENVHELLHDVRQLLKKNNLPVNPLLISRQLAMFYGTHTLPLVTNLVSNLEHIRQGKDVSFAVRDSQATLFDFRLSRQD